MKDFSANPVRFSSLYQTVGACQPSRRDRYRSLIHGGPVVILIVRSSPPVGDESHPRGAPTMAKAIQKRTPKDVAPLDLKAIRATLIGLGDRILDAIVHANRWRPIEDRDLALLGDLLQPAEIHAAGIGSAELPTDAHARTGDATVRHGSAKHPPAGTGRAAEVAAYHSGRSVHGMRL